jgi:hypothetical protein
VAPPGSARTLVRTATGLAALNLKYCGRCLRSPSASVYTAEQTSVCARAAFRSASTSASVRWPGARRASGAAVVSSSTARVFSVCSSAFTPTSVTARPLKLATDT